MKDPKQNPTESPTQDYLNYVRDVLGVSQILQPRVVADPDEQELADWARTRTGHWPPLGAIDLLVIHLGGDASSRSGVGNGLFQGESAELWEKMKSAMSLQGLRTLELETDHQDSEGLILKVLETYPATVTLLLSEAPTRNPAMRILGSSKVLESFSPVTLLSAPDLKRPAWGDLQAVMKALNAGKN